MKHPAHDVSIFYKYFFNYLLVVLIAITVFLSVFVIYVVNSYAGDASRTSVLRLERAKEDLDGQFFDCVDIARKIAGDFNFSPYNLAGRPPSVTAVEDLQNMQSYTGILSNILVIYLNPDIDYCYSPLGTIEKDYFDLYYQFDTLSLADIEELARTLEEPVILRTRQQSGWGMGRMDYIVYAFPVSSISKPYPSLVLFLMEAGKLGEILSGAFANTDQHAMIVDGDGQVLFSQANYDYQYGDGDMAERVLSRSGDGPVAVDRRTTLFVLESDTFDWSYAIITRSDIFAGALSDMAPLLGILTAVLLAMALSMAYSMARRSYRPIKELMDRLASRMGGRSQPDRAMKNEIGFIEQMFLVLRHEREALRQSIQEGHGDADPLLISLLSGNYSYMSREEVCASFGLPAGDMLYLLVLLRVDDARRFHLRYTSAAQQSVKNEVIGLLQDSLPGVRLYFSMIVEQNCTVGLAAYPKDEAETRETILGAVRTMQAAMDERHQITLSATASVPFNDLREAQKMLYSAIYASKYRFVRGYGVLIDMGDTDFSREYLDIESNAVFYNLYRSLMLGNGKEARDIAGDILAILRDNYSPETFQSVYMNMLSVFQKVNTEKIDDKQLSRLIDDCMQYEPETLEETRGIIDECLARMEMSAAGEKHEKLTRLKAAVLEFVTREYCNTELSLRMVADQFEVSPSYMSKFFKENVGVNLSVYVDTLRMNKAKELLLDTDSTAREIAEYVGYNDINNFHRKFKSREKITPIHYRNACRKDSETAR